MAELPLLVDLAAGISATETSSLSTPVKTPHTQACLHVHCTLHAHFIPEPERTAAASAILSATHLVVLAELADLQQPMYLMLR